MPPSFRLSGAVLRALVRRPALPALLVAATLMQGCNGPTTESAALPVPPSSTDTSCPITGADMADVLRASRTILLRSAEGVCAYGVPAPTGRADQDAPIARVQASSDKIADLRRQNDSPDPLLVVDRPDLGAGAFQRSQALLRGRQRVTLVFPRTAGVWTIAVDMPGGPGARAGALDRAEGVYDLLVSRQ